MLASAQVVMTDLGKVKGQNMIKAIFVASPDPFVQETGKYYPTYSHLLEIYQAGDQTEEQASNPDTEKTK